MQQMNNKKYQLLSRVGLALAVLYLLPTLLAFLIYIGILPAYIIWQEQVIAWNEFNKSWIALLLSLSILPASLLFWWLFRFPHLWDLYGLSKHHTNPTLLQQAQYENSQMRSILQQYYDMEKDIVALSQQKRVYDFNRKQNPEAEVLVLQQRLHYFLQQSCRNLAQSCLADVVFISTFNKNNPQQLQAEIYWEQGHFYDDKCWEISDFPDTGGIEDDVFIYHDAQINYPSKLIRDYQAQSYFALPLYSPMGEQIGLLCLLCKQANTLSPDLLVALNIYAHYLALLLHWRKQFISIDNESYASLFEPISRTESQTIPFTTMSSKSPTPETAYSSKNHTEFKLLVAEDSEINQVVLKKILMRLGYQADYVNNGKQALEFWQKNHYHLILMDCQMPKMDGYYTTQIIRATEKKQNLNHTPIIALTAYALNKHKERAKEVGMDEHISKPIKVGVLQALLERYSEPNLNPQHSPKKTIDSLPQNPFNYRPQVLNPAIMQDLSKTLGQQIGVLLTQFIHYLPEQMQALEQAISKKNTELLQRKAHQLKGETVQIGAETLGSLCKELEIFAQHNEFEQAEKHLSLMYTELSQVIRALQYENEKQQASTANE